jgi:hypothetical protein
MLQPTHLSGLVRRTQRLVAAMARWAGVSALHWLPAAAPAPPSTPATTSTCPSHPLRTACQASA